MSTTHNDPAHNVGMEIWSPQRVAEAQRRKEILLIDVRTPQEYMNAHIHGSLLVPMSEFDPDAFPQSATCLVVFFCGSGVRSDKVAKQFLKAGHGRAAQMEGGFAAWVNAGLGYMGVDFNTGDMVCVQGKCTA